MTGPRRSGSAAWARRSWTESGQAPQGGHDLLIAGWPQAAWHPELVGDPDSETPPAPTDEDLLVLYLGAPVNHALVERLAAAGGRVVPARNPNWDRWGMTIADPDGYRLVLSHRTWD